MEEEPGLQSSNTNGTRLKQKLAWTTRPVQRPCAILSSSLHAIVLYQVVYQTAQEVSTKSETHLAISIVLKCRRAIAQPEARCDLTAEHKSNCKQVFGNSRVVSFVGAMLPFTSGC